MSKYRGHTTKENKTYRNPRTNLIEFIGDNLVPPYALGLDVVRQTNPLLLAQRRSL